MMRICGLLLTGGCCRRAETPRNGRSIVGQARGWYPYCTDVPPARRFENGSKPSRTVAAVFRPLPEGG